LHAQSVLRQWEDAFNLNWSVQRISSNYVLYICRRHAVASEYSPEGCRMRLVPILIALVVSGLIYAFVLERDRLTAFLGNDARPAASEDTTKAQPSATEVTAAEPTSVVRVIAVKSRAREVDSSVILRGRTEANRIVELRSETSGLVISEPSRKGASVEAGQMLCRLDPASREASLAEARARLTEARARVPESQARVTEAQAQLEEAEINANAAANLVEGGYASKTRVAATRAALSSAKAAVQSTLSGLDAASAGIEGARAAVAAAEKEIERLTISAPFTGILETDAAEIGSLLRPGDLCATLLQIDPIAIVGFVSELQVDRVELGAKATARLASGRIAQGQVTFLSRAADDKTRTFRVDVTVANPDLTLRDGETAEITISAEGKSAHLLPQSALTLNDLGQLGVRFVDPESRAQFVPVALLRDSPQGIWLTGLPQEADVIIIGQEYVTDNVAVEATYQELGQ